MNRHITRFSEFRPSDVKDSKFEVDIWSVQTQGFVHSHPGRYEQAEIGCIGVGTEPLGRGELLGLSEEPCDLLVAIDMRGLTPLTIREKVCGGNLRARVNSAQPDGEAPDSGQTPSPLSRVDLGRLSGPMKCQFCGNEGGTLSSKKRHKIP
jgi:hypothetical protein